MVFDKLKEIKNKKRIVIGITVFLCAMIIAAVFYKNVVSTSFVYKEAVSLYNDYNYDEAAEKFESLGDYRDSRKRASECVKNQRDNDFNHALSLIDEQKYDEALAILNNLDDYQGRDALIEKCEALKAQQDIYSAVDPQYSKYYTIAKKYVKKYKKAKVKKQSEKSYTIEGVNLIQLIDFNGDGIEELVLGHRSSANSGSGNWEVYAFDGKSAKKAAAGNYINHGNYYSFDLVSADSGYELYFGSKKRGYTMSFDGVKFSKNKKWSKSENEFSYNSSPPFLSFTESERGFTVYFTTNLAQSTASNLLASNQRIFDMLKESYERTK